jgi:hypothetical protein
MSGHKAGRRIAMAALACAALATAMLPAAASAGTYPMHQCSAGVPAVSPGWSTYGSTTLASTSLSNNCSAGGMLGDYVFSNGQSGAVTENGSNGSQVGLNLSVPASAPDVTIQSITAEVLASSVTGDDAFLGFASEGQSLPGGVELPYGYGADYKAQDSWTLPQGAREWQTYVYCSTDRSSTTCDFNDSISVPALSDMTVTLEDDTPPTVSSVSGTLATAAADSSAVTGSQSLAFTGQDADSGVLSATLTLTPQGGGAAYTHTFSFAGECAYDAWNACPLTQNVSGFNLNTAALHDGAYKVDVSVTDAAGNVTEDALGTIATHNAPADTTLPSVLAPGQIVVGSALTSKPGEWSVPSEAGNVTYAYQWEDCNNKGESCQPITGANNADYTPAPSDAEHTLRLTVTATDNDGSKSATSSPTNPVSASQNSLGTSPGPGTGGGTNNGGGTSGDGTTTPPGGSGNDTTAPSSPTTPSTPSTDAGVSMNVGTPNGTVATDAAILRLGVAETITRSFARRAFTLDGRLVNSQGEPISGAMLEVLQQFTGTKSLQPTMSVKTHSNGTFTAKIPAGASRTIVVGYRAWSGESSYAARATVKESVGAGVQLSVTPQRIGSKGTITLAGKVAGPIPRHGVIVELLVHYRGIWEPFRTHRTSPNGRFRLRYPFQGGTGRFPFLASVPAGQAGFPFNTGNSRIVNVSAS